MNTPQPGRRSAVVGESSDHDGRVTRVMVHARTRELALQAGRRSSAMTQLDYEQARCELTGESDRDRQDAILDAGDRSPSEVPSRGS